MIANPIYTAPITSVPETANTNDWIDDDMSELASFKAPFTTVAYNPGIPPEGTAKPNLVPPYIFNQRFNSWQNKQNRERPVHDIGNTSVGSSARLTFQVGHVDHQHGRTHLPKVKEVLAEHEASIMKKIKQNLGVDIRGDTTIYQKPYPSRFDWAPSPANFRLPDFVKFSGEDSMSTREHVSQYLAQLGEASYSEALAVRMFPLSLTGTAFSWFASLAPGSINSWLDLKKNS
jgi:hypothetical protein